MSKEFWIAYLACSAGVVIGILLPILRALLPKPLGDRGFREAVKPYLVVGIFAVLTALLLVAFVPDIIGNWKAALLAGYTWESTLEKIGTRPVQNGT
jgi:hypothetical protein